MKLLIFNPPTQEWTAIMLMAVFSAETGLVSPPLVLSPSVLEENLLGQVILYMSEALPVT